MVIAGLIGTALGLLPFILLFVDYRKRREIHKPLIYLAAFSFTIAVLLPIVLKSLGIWIVLAVPLALFIMVVATRKARRS